MKVRNNADNILGNFDEVILSIFEDADLDIYADEDKQDNNAVYTHEDYVISIFAISDVECNVAVKHFDEYVLTETISSSLAGVDDCCARILELVK